MSRVASSNLVVRRRPELGDAHTVGWVLQARFAGFGRGWNTPQHVPGILREFGYEPDVYVCDRTQRVHGVRVDIERKWRPDIVADMNRLPFRDRAFRCTFFDPPYDVPYKKAVREVARVSSERLAVLHVRDVHVPFVRSDPWRREATILLLCGRDSVVRCLNLWRRWEPWLTDRRGPRGRA